MSLHVERRSVSESDPAASRSSGWTAAEARAMRVALRLARRGIGSTHPNPRVGAVVLRGGEIVAEGYHARAGEAHAEVRALEAAGDHARGGTLVATLEPCAHFGKTPPCVDAILAADVRRVVIGMRDPNPLVDGRGIGALERAGLDVVVGTLEDECRELNPPYLKQLRTGLPWVVLKAMLSLDGRMASDSGESRGLGGDDEIRVAHRLRAVSDAVIAGVGTILADDPLLTVRRSPGRTPVRVILDSSLRTPPGAAIWSTIAQAPVVLATVSRDDERARALAARGASVWTFDPDPTGRVPLQEVLRRLVDEGRYSVLVEGGSEVHTSFLREGLADRIAIGVAPVLLGGAGAPTLTRDLGRARLHEGIAVEELRVKRLGRDLWIEGAIVPEGGSRV
ncbi:MAG TPA: bifunctional diaminohydroxyphosphoribosylaminopyrimidine deaminase/5-amino-6-(5-phosphoribosylamino)uracil reductase RibD [Candidatus Eisenbacteria bacterium]|nr:bifunctional diaminohydroxyphosphoribosylaminopyrimidine deaminase/5-amino-6-(5-phosphoribosylamino)uracil reductase RibD [Candidatus Eisenbacteria bacterium]